MKLKLYFGVEDSETKECVVEKSQQTLDISDVILDSVRKVPALQSKFDSIDSRGVPVPAKGLRPSTKSFSPEDEKELLAAFGALQNAKRNIREIMEASGIVMHKFCLPKIIEYIAKQNPPITPPPG